MSTAKNAAEVIAALLAQAGLDLPVRLRAWDGSEAGSLEPLDGPVLVARSPRALQRILWRPGELGLARAYVSATWTSKATSPKVCSGCMRLLPAPDRSG